MGRKECVHSGAGGGWQLAAAAARAGGGWRGRGGVAGVSGVRVERGRSMVEGRVRGEQCGGGSGGWCSDAMEYS